MAIFYCRNLGYRQTNKKCSDAVVVCDPDIFDSWRLALDWLSLFTAT